MVHGQDENYPVIVSVGGECILLASHSNNLEEGNWIQLSGGTPISIPVLSLAYEGPDSVTYSSPGGDVSIGSLIGDGSATYPLGTHQVYSTGQSIIAKFWGSSAFAGYEVDFKLIKISSVAEVKDIAVDAYNGNLDPLKNFLSGATDITTLDGSGDATVDLGPQSVGTYLLVVKKKIGLDINIYSATVVEVVEQTLYVSCPSSVEKGDRLNIDTGAGAISAAVLIKESAYKGEVKLVSDGTVLSTEIYLNDVKMVDGSFATEPLSIETALNLLDTFETAFDSDEMAMSVNLFGGSLSLQTSSLDTGNYVLLAGVVKLSPIRIVGVYQKTVTVRPEYTPPVNEKPLADAGPDQMAYVDETVDFSGAGSKDTDGYISSYEWDFGDGDTASGVEVQHSYSETGSYTVTLTVEDDDGAKDTDSCLVTVTEIPTEMGVLIVNTEPVKGEVFVDGESWGIAPQTKAVEAGTYPVSFGDVAGYITPEPMEAVVEIGLTTNIVGTYTEITEKQPPVADAGGPYYCDRYDIILLDGSGSQDPDGSIVSYEWDFGDGTTGTGVNPSHIYSSTGTFIITLTVTDDDGLTDSDSTTVTVSKPPSPPPSPGKPNKEPKADAGPNMKISVGSTIHFNGAGSEDPDGTILSHIWDFGDGTTATGAETDHTYTEPGNYTVTLVVKDNKGAADSDKCEVMVWEPPAPVAGKFGELVPSEQKGFKVDAMDEANTIVILDTTDDVTVTILRYEENPHPDDPMPANALPIYIDIEVSDPDAVEWPIYVEVYYTDEEVEGLDEESLGIYYWKDGEWKRCSDTGVDAERNVVWAYMTMEEASGSPILIGGMHAIIVPPLPPYLSDLTITPEEVELGGDVTISLLVENIDSQSITYIVTMQIEGRRGDLPVVVYVELEAYESMLVSQTITPVTVGDHDVTVDGLEGSYTVNPVPIVLAPAEFIISDLTVSPTEVLEGESVTVTVNIINTGEEEGTHTVLLEVDGLVTELAEVTLEGGASTTVSFTLTEAEGVHTVGIDDLTGSFTVTAPPGFPSTGYVAGILIIIIAAGAVVYMLYRGGRLPLPKSTPGPENPGD